MSRWAVYEGVGIPQVAQVDDLREHDIAEDGKCWCVPTYDDGVLVHHAADGREAYENGREALGAGA